MKRLSLSEVLNHDISGLGEGDNGCWMDEFEPFQIVFIGTFVYVGIMIIIGGICRYLSLEKLCNLYSMNRHRMLQFSVVCLVLGSAFLSAMSYTPCNASLAHTISAGLGISFILIAQIMDAINWQTIHRAAIRKSYALSPSCTDIVASVLIFLFPMLAAICFIFWRIESLSILEWIGVSLMMLTFMLYGLQTICIHSFIALKSKMSL